MASVTFIRTSRGHFDVYKDGVQTNYEIVNGDLGTSGYGPNTYGISCYGNGTCKVRWIGSLANTKKAVTYWLTASK